MTPEQQKKILSTSFDSFDDFDDEFDDEFDDDFDDNFDDDSFKGRRARAKRTSPNLTKKKGGYFTIQVTNAHAALAPVELFNANNSIAQMTNTQLFPTTIPFNALQRDAANLNNVAYFDNAGNLVINNSTGLALTISCKQIAYKTLLENMGKMRAVMSKVKMTFTNDPQLDNDITHTVKTFLGKDVSNSITPRVYFKDGQFQSKQVTLPNKFVIDGQSGLFFQANSGETISLSFFLEQIGTQF